MREFNLIKNPNDCGNLYYRSKVVFEPGVTVLVGCNGCGKTSMIRQLKRQLDKNDIPYVAYDNLSDGGSNARSRAGFYGQFDILAASMCSSEGENIVINMQSVARSMGALSKNHPNAKELWFIFDAIDSGLSIDNVLDIKEYLFKTVFEHNKDKDVYIVVSANAYEMCCGEKCFDTYLGKYIDINSYEDYKKFILKSRERKDNREEKLRNKRSTRR